VLSALAEGKVSIPVSLSRNGPLRQTLAAVKMPDQGPVFQGDHPSNLIGWLLFNRRDWPDFQPSSTAADFDPETVQIDWSTP
jgi:hypothetical protein